MYLSDIDFIELEFDLVCVNSLTAFTRRRNTCGWCILKLVLLLCLDYWDRYWLIAIFVTHLSFINLDRWMNDLCYIILKRFLGLTHALGLLLDLMSIILLLLSKYIHIKHHSLFFLFFSAFFFALLF